MAKSTAAVILVILIIGAVSGYFFYTRYVQGTVVLSITDPPQAQPANGQQYDPAFSTSILPSQGSRYIKAALETLATIPGTR
jgi:hypothetical protein